MSSTTNNAVERTIRFAISSRSSTARRQAVYAVRVVRRCSQCQRMSTRGRLALLRVAFVIYRRERIAQCSRRRHMALMLEERVRASHARQDRRDVGGRDGGEVSAAGYEEDGGEEARRVSSSMPLAVPVTLLRQEQRQRGGRPARRFQHGAASEGGRTARGAITVRAAGTQAGNMHKIRRHCRHTWHSICSLIRLRST